MPVLILEVPKNPKHPSNRDAFEGRPTVETITEQVKFVAKHDVSREICDHDLTYFRLGDGRIKLAPYGGYLVIEAL